MTSITLRSIPDEVMSLVRNLSAVEKRSLNNELVLLIEEGLNRHIGNMVNMKRPGVSRVVRANILESIAGKWIDTRSTRAIIKDIYNKRTSGRDVNL